jgi:hypothetical protein
MALGTDTGGSALPLCDVTSRAPVWALVVTLSWTSGCLTTRAAGIDLQQGAVFGSSGTLLFQLLAGRATGAERHGQSGRQ